MTAPRAHVLTIDGVRYFLVARDLDEEPALPCSITPAERDVLRLLALDLTNEEIAARRKSRPRTVANQVASLLRRFGCDNRTALAVIGRRLPSP